MKANPWFRFYSDFIYDDKVEFLAFEDQRHYVFILCMKNLGLLDKEYPQEFMLDAVVGRRLGLQGESLINAKTRLRSMGLIDDSWQPIGWDKRQFVSDSDASNAERQRRYRERMKSAQQEVLVSNVTSNVTVTPLDTDKETETETDKKKTRATAVATPVGVSDSVWQDFLKVRKAKKAPVTAAALKGIEREAKAAGWTLENALSECCMRGWIGFKAEWVAAAPQVQRGPALPNQTVPSRQEIDPALAKIQAEQAIVKPPSAEMREKLAALKRGVLPSQIGRAAA